MLGCMSGQSAGTQAGLHGLRKCARRFRAIRGCSGCNISGIEMREVGAAIARRVRRIAGGLRRLRRALDDRGVGVTGLHMLTTVQFLFAVIGHRADTLNPITSDRQVRFQAQGRRRRTRGRGGAARAEDCHSADDRLSHEVSLLRLHGSRGGFICSTSARLSRSSRDQSLIARSKSCLLLISPLRNAWKSSPCHVESFVLFLLMTGREG